ncbi:cell division protein FtsB [Saccharobesus litoralis]|uniref:Cell division protein FtsB n=1 Tax=Saccharobesus litoralis TaxID=2172099 RepID=A0A2S0VTQ4_9ALTE|nr:cell division protein FtsB [Saccharobesus litoralis]AWB67589.1 cell division protein FtsB [Saccharobesus litoralis]
MSLFRLVLIVLLCMLQYRLWFGGNSISEYSRLQQKVETIKLENDKLSQRNKLMVADIKDLKMGVEAIEERARNELGLIRQGELFYRVIPK